MSLISTQLFLIVVNEQEQYSIWPVDKSLPNGWMSISEPGKKEECFEQINRLWLDMRPKSLRDQCRVAN